MDIDSMIDFAVVRAEIRSGTNPDWISSRFNIAPVATMTEKRKKRNPGWTKEEEKYLRENYDKLPVPILSAQLHRSPEAIKIWLTRNKVPGASRAPGYLTGHKVAYALGTDIHSICLLDKRGLMPFEHLPGERGILRIHKVTFYRWAVNPNHWMYFKVKNMRDLHLRRLVELAQERWGDEWWTIGRAADYLGIPIGALNQSVRKGKVPGAVRWGNWWIRKSVAMQITIKPGKGSAKKNVQWSARADEFLLRAANQGMRISTIAKLMKWPHQRVYYRLHVLGYKCSPQ